MLPAKLGDDGKPMMPKLDKADRRCQGCKARMFDVDDERVARQLGQEMLAGQCQPGRRRLASRPGD